MNYSILEVERLLSDVGVNWPANSYSHKECGKGRTMLLALSGLRRIINDLSLPVDISKWTEEHKMAFA